MLHWRLPSCRRAGVVGAGRGGNREFSGCKVDCNEGSIGLTSVCEHERSEGEEASRRVKANHSMQWSSEFKECEVERKIKRLLVVEAEG